MLAWIRRITSRWGSGISLAGVLERCRVLSAASLDPIYSRTGVADIVAILDRAIESLQKHEEPNRTELKLLFAPTGPLQETSIDNGWGVEFLVLSARFDDLIG